MYPVIPSSLENAEVMAFRLLEDDGDIVGNPKYISIILSSVKNFRAIAFQLSDNYSDSVGKLKYIPRI